MSGRWSKKDVLQQQRRRKKNESRYWTGMGAVLVGAVVVGIFILSAGGDDEEVVEEHEEEPILAFAEAWTRVEAGVGMAREQLESGEAEARVQAQREEEARHAEWEEGAPVFITGELEPEESVYLALMRRNVPDPSIHHMVVGMEEIFDFGRVRAGDEWSAQVTEAGKIEEFRYETSPEDIWVTRLDEDGSYVTEKEEIDVEIRHRAVAGTVEHSFWLAMEAAGHSGVLAHRFMKVFEYTIDFNTETRNGDHFAMVVEEIYLDDELLRYGKILAAQYIGHFATRKAFHFETEEESGYFAEDGDSMQRQFLRSPLAVSRVTSNFGRRTHPITGDQRVHRGVDYGAPTGTRVQAVADGRVVYAGWNGGYGNLLTIRHSGGYQTRYAHLSEIDVSVGTRVTQGQVVARSGNTGASTGPHLHYEMIQSGRHIDPLSVTATSGDPITGEELEVYTSDHVEPLLAQLHQVIEQELPDAWAAINEADEEDESAELASE